MQILIIISSAVLVAGLCTAGILNTNGYCLSERRILSKDELITPISKRVYRRLEWCASSNECTRIEVENGRRVNSPIYPNQYKYSSLDEFIELNKDCCSLHYHPGPRDEDKVDNDLNVTIGAFRTYIKTRYISQLAGVNRATNTTYFERWYKVSNCGSFSRF